MVAPGSTLASAFPRRVAEVRSIASTNGIEKRGWRLNRSNSFNRPVWTQSLACAGLASQVVAA